MPFAANTAASFDLKDTTSLSRSCSVMMLFHPAMIISPKVTKPIASLLLTDSLKIKSRTISAISAIVMRMSGSVHKSINATRVLHAYPHRSG